MMISLNITGDNAEDFASQVHGFVSLLNGTAPAALIANGGTAQATDKPARKARETKAADPTLLAKPAKQDTVEAGGTSPNEDTAQVQETSSAGQTAPSDASPSDEDATNADKVKARAVLYAQKAGAPALTEMLVQAGAKGGKFSDITNGAAGDNYDPVAIRKVSDALAAAGY